MASAKSLEEMLSSEVDERAVNAFIQSLDSQLSSNVHLPPQDIVTGGNNYTPKQSSASSDALKHGGLERSTMTTNNSQAFCINNIASSALTDNVVVTLATALPASGYISQVANTQTQSTVMKNMTVDGNPEMKIYTQGNIAQLNSAHISSGNRTVIQRNNIKHTNVANGNINVTGQPGATMLIPAASLKTTSQAKSTAVPSSVMVSNVTNPVLVQHPMILTTESQCSINGSINQVVSGIQEQKPQINSESILIPYSKQGTNIPVCSRDITAIGKGSTSIKNEIGLPLSTSVASAVPITSTVQSQQHTKPLNVVTQVVSSGSIMPGVQIFNMCVANSGTQKTLAPRMGGFSSPLRITASPQVIAARPRVAVPNAITLPQGIIRNTLLVRTETGQFQMVNVAPGLAATGSIPGATTYRLEAVQPRTHTSVTNSVLQPNQQGLNVVASIPPTAGAVSSQPHIKKTSPSSLSQPLTIQTSLADGQVPSSSSSQMSPNTAKKKCKNFLSTLIRLTSKQPNHVAANVKNIIQRIVDGVINPEEFSNQLQKELNSAPQPSLIPFLKKNLPYLRHSLMTGELSIEGIRPPAPGSVILPTPQVLQVKSIPQPSHLRVVSPSVLQGTLASSLGQRLVTPRLPGVTGIKTVSGSKSITEVFAQPTKSVLASRASSSSSSKEREKDKKNFASLRDDDDINDVAAMGGVNLLEETQRILATNAEIVGTQIRSCKDETFFSSGFLHRRILKIANKFGLDDVSSEATALISHAAQERLKSIVEKLGLVVANYVENPKADSRFDIVSDVMGQIDYLKEVDRLRSENLSRERDETLTDPSKVRLKVGNSEETSLQHREKALSNSETRFAETNLTALLAIGPRKRLKSDLQENWLSEATSLPQNHAHINQNIVCESCMENSEFPRAKLSGWDSRHSRLLQLSKVE